MGDLAIKTAKGRSGRFDGFASRMTATRQSPGVRCILRSGGRERLQTKLRISNPGDAFEREADRVADQVMRMPEPQTSSTLDESSRTDHSFVYAATIQRSCAACRDEEGLIQTKSAAVLTPVFTPEISDGIRALRGGGHPLSKSEQHFFTPRMGVDFSNVRIHDDRRAATLARSIDARAFTIGRDVVFDSGEYAPGSPSGRKLLAHELTHVVQQKGGESYYTARSVQDTVMREDATPTRQFTSCTQDQIDMIEPARRAAAIRCQRAAFQTKGMVPPGPPGRSDPAENARRRARRIARTVFGEDLNMEQVGDIVSEMGARLTSPNLSFTCSPASDSNCSNRAAYVIGNRAPVYLCPAFFDSHSDEERIRTLIHEAAHLSGIGESMGESYCPVIDCQSACGGFDVADAWLHYVHCVTGQATDEPIQ